MKKRLYISLALLLPIVILLAATNMIVDPANLYHPGYERSVVAHLLKGKNVSNVSNYDERILQKLFINGIDFKPDVVAIGSSRVMLINKEEFPGIKFCNNGVSGATVEDVYAIFHLYEKADKLPKKVILGLDPWFLNQNNGQFRWKSLARTYTEAANLVKGTSSINLDMDFNYSKLTEFLSLPYFQSSIDFLKERKNKKIIPTDSAINTEFTRKVDGGIVYAKKMRDKTPDQVDVKAKSYITGDNVYSMSKFDHISMENLEAIEKLIEYMKKKNIEVILFLPPYHPIVYDFVSKNENKYKFIEIENLYRGLAAKNSLKIVGSYDPGKYGLDHSYFYDGMHFKESALPLLTHDGKDFQ